MASRTKMDEVKLKSKSRGHEYMNTQDSDGKRTKYQIIDQMSFNLKPNESKHLMPHEPVMTF